jgi:hypothetical protein
MAREGARVRQGLVDAFVMEQAIICSCSRAGAEAGSRQLHAILFSEICCPCLASGPHHVILFALVAVQAHAMHLPGACYLRHGTHPCYVATLSVRTQNRRRLDVASRVWYRYEALLYSSSLLGARSMASGPQQAEAQFPDT